MSYELRVKFSQESESANQISIRLLVRKLWRFEVSKIAILVSHVKSMGLKKIMNWKNAGFRLDAANTMKAQFDDTIEIDFLLGINIWGLCSQ